jgi:hypothetical protein
LAGAVLAFGVVMAILCTNAGERFRTCLYQGCPTAATNI